MADLVITVLIIGILAATGAPSFIDALGRFRVENAAKRVAADLRLAMREAEASSASRTVQFNVPQAHVYTLLGVQNLNHVGLPYEVDLMASPYSASLVSVNFGGDATVVFDGYGVADSGGTLVVESGGYQKTVTLDAASGKVEIQ